MQRWTDPSQVPADLPRSVVTIGNFDGVHAGHRAVLGRVVDRARGIGAPALVVTFTPHPRTVHRPEVEHVGILSADQRAHRLAESGVDGVLEQHYTLEFARQSPEEFVRSTFVETLNASVVVVGRDVRFGRDNAGDFDTMVELGRRHGFEVEAVEELPADVPGHPGRRCSSTWIRQALAAGEVAQAAAVLGRHHRVSGEVVHGHARGRELGFPTANLCADAEGLIPADGVYAGWLCDATGRRWPAAVSVGTNPTFEGVRRTVEAHVIDRPEEPVEDFDLYGQRVDVDFVEHIRGMVAYEGVERLIAQMHDDVRRVRAILSETHEPAEGDGPSAARAQARG
ncbi:riboflavin kinase/FMN adenylyltransferase [Micrococcus cohnii]|uniref:Riboflavin biosynthesis protein n=1 Tax=Micrococcus cohnii TaxID=993416 RepID=A0A7W7GMI1_9MICC|nr:riboflavin kinase/FMN adenylyltransferase [Micrococcus cohnii]